MSLKDTAERLRRRAKELRGEVEGTVESLTGSLPRPLRERKTLVLRQSLLKTLEERLRKKVSQGSPR